MPISCFHHTKLNSNLQKLIGDPAKFNQAGMQMNLTLRSILNQCSFLFTYETKLLYLRLVHIFRIDSNRAHFYMKQSLRNNEHRRAIFMAHHRRDEQRAPEKQKYPVERGADIVEQAKNLMPALKKKAVLEVMFKDEEGTGLGPTLEFFALVAGEFQRSDLGMWLNDDAEKVSGEAQDMGNGEKPSGYYVIRKGGLFPAPLPQDTPLCKKVAGLFYILGVFLAKTLQDGRLVDLPLSDAFLKLLCGGEVSGAVKESSRIMTSFSPELLEDVMTSSLLSVVSEESEDLVSPRSEAPWWSGLMELDPDLTKVDPGRGETLAKLQELANKKINIMADESLDDDTKAERINGLEMDGCSVEDLCLTFQYSPSSAVYEYEVNLTNEYLFSVK